MLGFSTKIVTACDFVQLFLAGLSTYNDSSEVLRALCPPWCVNDLLVLVFATGWSDDGPDSHRPHHAGGLRQGSA